MLPTATNRSHRTGLPATGLGSILVVAPLLAVGAGDRAVAAAAGVAVAVGDAPPASADGRVHDLAGTAPAAVAHAEGAARRTAAGR